MLLADCPRATIAFVSDMAALARPRQVVIYPRHDIQTRACLMHICSAIMDMGPGPSLKAHIRYGYTHMNIKHERVGISCLGISCLGYIRPSQAWAAILDTNVMVA